MLGELTVERGLQNPLGQLRQQSAFAGQLQPRGAGPLDQPADQVIVHTGRQPGSCLLFTTAAVSTASDVTVIRCVSLIRSYTVVLTQSLRTPVWMKIDGMATVVCEGVGLVSQSTIGWGSYESAGRGDGGAGLSG